MHQDILKYYETLVIEYHFPAQLAAAMTAAVYGSALTPPPLPALKETLQVVAVLEPELKRDIGRTTAAIDRLPNVERKRGRPASGR